MRCPRCSSEIPLVRLLTAVSGRTACSHCRVQVRPRLKRKGVWVLGLVLAQAMNLSALWVGSPVMVETMIALGAVMTALIGLMALYSFEPALVD